ncbi:MAG: succinate dehydrogenase, hydrophobic membrane anchor protein [Betaproteobacteria bacterium HGW-Betaproteobacteria-22]|nr:MAG: succinate dehydrogenase, hydrophobic membrane anchor protein [Betaproteobacteria bacterium HGW-Betaproteobacteria-22]
MLRKIRQYTKFYEYPIFFISLIMHAWIGVRNVFRDYIVNIKLRESLQMAVDLLLVAYLCLVFYILWGI